MMPETDGPPASAKQLGHRYEGIAKVTGKIKYAAEFSQPFSKAELLYAYMVQSYDSQWNPGVNRSSSC